MSAPSFERLLVCRGTTLRQTIECINAAGRGIALVVDDDRHFLDAVTDGDIRRAILAGVPLSGCVTAVLAEKARWLAGDRRWPGVKTITAPLASSAAERLRLLEEYPIMHLPLLDPEGRVAGIAFKDELLEEIARPFERVRPAATGAIPAPPADLPAGVAAVVMAGGFGRRLQPLTRETPKPMLRVGGRPMLEHVIESLARAGIRSVFITTHYRPEAIRDHFGDGARFGVEIEYIHEEEPRGTAGAVALVRDTAGPLLVMNGDVLTRVDLRALIAFHVEHRADLTVGVSQYDVRVPYGVVQTDGATVRAIEEKPELNFLVNAGIYCLEPGVRQLIPGDRPSDMPDVIAAVGRAGGTVVAFPIVEYWLDIGRHTELERAQEEADQWLRGRP